MAIEDLRYAYAWNRFIARSRPRKGRRWRRFSWVLIIVGILLMVVPAWISEQEVRRLERLQETVIIQLFSRTNSYDPVRNSIYVRKPRVAAVGDAALLQVAYDRTLAVTLVAPSFTVVKITPTIPGDIMRGSGVLEHLERFGATNAVLSMAAQGWIVSPKMAGSAIVVLRFRWPDGRSRVYPISIKVVDHRETVLQRELYAIPSVLGRLQLTGDQTVKIAGLIITVLGATARFINALFPTRKRKVYLPTDGDPIVQQLSRDALDRYDR